MGRLRAWQGYAALGGCAWLFLVVLGLMAWLVWLGVDDESSFGIAIAAMCAVFLVIAVASNARPTSRRADWIANGVVIGGLALLTWLALVPLVLLAAQMI